MRCVVSCSSTSFPWFVFFFGALLWGSKIHKHTGSWMWQGSASVDRHTDSTSRDWFIKYLPLKSSFVNTRYKWGFWGDIFDESVPACAVCFSIHPSGYLSSCLCVQLCLDNISWTAQPFLTKLGMEVECHTENLFTIFNVKITAKAYILKIWLFQLYLLKCCSVCQTLFDKPEWLSEEKRVYCVQGQGHIEGSKCQWMFVWIIIFGPQNILLPNLVWWCRSWARASCKFLLLL